jgi:hypothetical protein
MRPLSSRPLTTRSFAALRVAGLGSVPYDPSIMARRGVLGGFVAIGLAAACGGGSPAALEASGGGGGSTTGVHDAGPLPEGGTVPPPVAPACAKAAGGGAATVAAPTLLTKLADRWQESWLASPAVVDLDGDGKSEILVARSELLIAWRLDGSVLFRFDTGGGRIWASPVVGDFVGDARPEIAVAARDKVWLLDASGAPLPGFPVTWQDEMRSLAAGDLDGDGHLDLVAALAHGSPSDVVAAWRSDGRPVPGFPPNATGASGCAADGKCYLAGCYDQNLAIGDLDGDGKADVIVPHDDAYASFHRGTGEAFDANPMFPVKKTPGVRYLYDLAEAKQGYSDHEATSLQAHFTNSAPAIADLDGDGKPDVVLLGSTQNASQDNRLLGVGVFAVRPDASRLASWQSPVRAPDYLAGLWDFDGTNVVAATNQITVADLDPAHAGPELVFAGFDGRIHAVSADAHELFATTYTTDPRVLTGGVVVADLSGDGAPEIVFATYSPDADKAALFVLGAAGAVLQKVALPGRGAMAVPTIADVDGDGALDIVVSLKDAVDKVDAVHVYRVPASAPNCLPWPTGRGNLLRSGFVPPAAKK